MPKIDKKKQFQFINECKMFSAIDWNEIDKLMSLLPQIGYPMI